MRTFYIYNLEKGSICSIQAKEIKVATGTGQILFYNDKGAICGVASSNSVVSETL
jgi:hypothetical protein